MSAVATINIEVEENDIRLSSTLPSAELYLVFGQLQYLILSGQLKKEDDGEEE